VSMLCTHNFVQNYFFFVKYYVFVRVDNGMITIDKIGN
jgi:hypothetical protein